MEIPSSRFSSQTVRHSVADLLEEISTEYLRLLAARQLDVSLATRLSASDIVQQTQLEAFRDFGLFRGHTEEQFVGWLKSILTNNVAQATHTHILAKKRTVRREQSPAVEGPRDPAGVRRPRRVAIRDRHARRVRGNPCTSNGAADG